MPQEMNTRFTTSNVSSKDMKSLSCTGYSPAQVAINPTRTIADLNHTKKASTCPQGTRSSGKGKTKTTQAGDISLRADLTEKRINMVFTTGVPMDLIMTQRMIFLESHGDDDQDDEQAQDDEDADKNDVTETTQDDEDDDDHDDDKKAQDDDDEELTESDDDGDDFISDKKMKELNVEGAKVGMKRPTYEEDQGNGAVKDTNTDLDGRENVMTDVILPCSSNTRKLKDSIVTLNSLILNGQQQQLIRADKELIDRWSYNSINMSDIQRWLYKALVDAYEADKILLDTYGDTVTIKRPRDGCVMIKNLAGISTEVSKRRRKSASQSAPVEEAMQTTDVFEAPAHQEFETDFLEPIVTKANAKSYDPRRSDKRLKDKEDNEEYLWERLSSTLYCHIVILAKSTQIVELQRYIKVLSHYPCDLPEHQSEFFTMKMEILTEPTSNKLIITSILHKITTSCEICSGPHDTRYCMEKPEQAFVEYASSRTDEAKELVSEFMASQDARLSKFEANFKQQQSEMTNKIDIVLKAITDRIAGTLPSDTVKNPKLGTHPVSSARSYPTIDPQCSSSPVPSRSMLSRHSSGLATLPPNQPSATQDKKTRNHHN
ncbi:hypothetical protein Tco_0532183 [Tanacetum coccineum]